MARALFTLAGLGIAFILMLIGLPYLMPVGTYMDKVSQDVSAKTGRDLKVNGTVSFRLFPSIRLSATNVTISNPPGFSSPYFATMDQFALSVKLIPLLSGEIEVDRFLLDHPRIAIETLADGQTNMDFDDKDKGARPKKTYTSPTSISSGHAQVNLPNGLRLGEVKLVDGEITLKDDRHDSFQKFDQINVSVSLPSLEGEMDVDGRLNYGAHAFNLKIALSPFGPFMKGSSASLHLMGTAPALNLKFDGSVDRDGHPMLVGALNVDAPSMPDLMKFLDYPAVGNYADLGVLSFVGQLSAERTKAALTQTRLTLGPVAATGDLSADLSQKPPIIDGRMQVRGAAGMAAGLDVPMIVSGPVNGLTIRPDVESLVKDKLGSTTGLVNELVRMKDKQSDQAPDDPAATAKGLIQGLLKK